ncbi:hypothetical protein [[Flexibacter] sp. ATCC 35208]|uniref:hypothetical protein n=1 Tax=[Flexibacter] sp. ATCC 35208 TaxID=1936242 RepID=UPI0009D46F35|nr:hypothetical protein [[Flexibacter] sp. ATCC 35208]OMP80030.1 hypothetical protein BW716_05935 [[Flexibacter] sp. ATCC 35208]
MSLVYQLLNEQEHLLTSKGYDEKSLNSPDKAGYLLKELQRQLGICLRDSLVDDGPFEFQLRTVGFYNNDRDCVSFNLHYSFDPEKVDLSITRLDVGFNHQAATVKLCENSMLPHASKAMELFEVKDLTNKTRRQLSPLKGKSKNRNR